MGGDFAPFRAKMQAAGLSEAATKAFEASYEALVSGETGMIAEDSINATDDIPYLDGKAGSIRESVTADPALLQETVVLKLNGGLGTSMGLDKAKSLLNVKGDDTFLDIMAKQVTALRAQHQSNVRFVLMNSFSTSADTLEYLAKYPEILADENLELLQNKVPKVDAATFAPATNPANEDKEWCPPGHGDLYPSLAGSDKLDKLLAQGVKYMFVSNSDNLGATLDLDLLTYFAQSGKPFLMECCERTENDKKGGHLAQRKADSRLILRESAQCASADEGHFQNINKHRYFNTNNLWIRLDKLKEELEKQGGVIRLPMIKNAKTVDPKDSSSTPVFQLETAMGAAIECFDGAGAVCVPRTRFAPVKKCDDLLLLRSDAYVITEDYRPVIAPERNGVAPIVSLDGKTFKLVQQLEAALRGNVPSLVKCDRLKITGKVGFAPGVVFEGNVTVVNNSSEEKTLLAGTYKDTTVDLSAKEESSSAKPVGGDFAPFRAKMQSAGLSDAAIKAFEFSYESLVSGETGMIGEDSINATDDIPYLEGKAGSIRESVTADPALLQETVVLKLNGGLGTSMGLDKAKSLLTVKDDDTFLDIMAKQVTELRSQHQSNVRFVLMNSFSTSADTLEYLAKYPEIVEDENLELVQNKVPKVDAATFAPATNPTNPGKEWCPPGHGDLYPSLAGSGKLDKLLAQGVKYMFVSNSDNLGATLDLDLLTYFAQSGKPFLMECCERTENDKKGGHLAQRKADSRLILRESAQCASADEGHFQNINKHRYFNTNNLWIRLDKLKEELEKQGGVIRLPMIKNAKTVDPKDSSSTPVFQLETAMGAAIECFDGAGAVCVPRTRFAPVKKCDDLLLLRSDAYVITEDYRPVIAPERNGVAPIVSLDGKTFKLVQQLEAALRGNVPSLVKCDRLKITGKVGFAPGVVFEGNVTVVNNSSEEKTLLAGTYKDTTVDLSAKEESSSAKPVGGDFAPFRAKMQSAGLSDAAIKAFEFSYESLVSGETGMIGEDSINATDDIPYLEGKAGSIRESVTADPALLQETVVLKLNGGLGTSMGLDKAKSLLTVKDDDTFLDIMAKQVTELRSQHQSNVRFVLMNSFSTSADTLEYLAKYPEIVEDENLELVQNKVPKVDAATFAPATNPTNPGKEWCPPGHGDLYPSLAGSGKLDKLLAQGVKYMFVSNSDNLGATLDLDLLTYFAQSGKPFLMECCERTENDKKGGHLAQRKADSRLILRESAQCASADEGHFQNINKHRYFNTNNLWIRLDKLKEELEKQGGVIRLPMIKNAKTVDPKDSSSTPVFQLETAMGAAIECFDGAGAVCVPRTRFAPVKKCDDLLLLRSDAYVITEDYRPVIAPERNGVAPIVSLDGKTFKLVQQLEAALRGNVPSLVKCDRLKITGKVGFAPGVVFEGNVTVVNNSSEEKTLLAGTYKDTTVDLTAQKGLGPLKSVAIKTTPIADQKPGTSGLRKKTKTFMEGHYLHNFVQSVFDALPPKDVQGGTLVVSGDGRYFNKDAIQIIIKIGVAAGVERFWIGKDGLLSTPAVSAVIREREGGSVAFGAFILSASHNPGGPDEDFGIKYNCENGGPAPEKVTNEIFNNTKTISTINMAVDFPIIDVTKTAKIAVSADDGSRSVVLEIFDSTEDHVALLKKIFDFEAIKKLLARDDFSLVADSMWGVQGPYAHRVFVQELGAPVSSLINGTPKEDFNGGHADPNLTYAKELIKIMGVDNKGLPVFGQPQKLPAFGVAWDGDADRNMILGERFFVTPSDSLAIIAANANLIPFFKKKGGVRGVARSMPTSGAVDLVAKKLGIALFEVPTGWKFFGNLMDSGEVYGKEDYTPFICGEESFGTGSNHVREKDGMWAALAWLSILAAKQTDGARLVTVEDIVRAHWQEYGRNYYCRYDYENVDKAGAEAMFAEMTKFDGVVGKELNGFTIKIADQFEYHDPVDGSVSKNQGVRFIFEDGSRVVFRLSGTGVAGATVRMYIEKYEAPSGNLAQDAASALAPLIDVGLQLSSLEKHTGRKAPTVIT